MEGWDCFNRPTTLYFFMRALMKAGEDGSFVASLSRLAMEFHLSVKQVRMSISNLTRANIMASIRAEQGTKLTICRFDIYRGRSNKKGQAVGRGKGLVSTLAPLSPSSSSPAPLLSTTPLSPSSEKKTAIAVKDTPLTVEAADRLYLLYPTKCPISGRSTGKSSKDKARLAKMLRDGEYTEEGLASIIRRYVGDCVETRSYMKNFSTFLNNVPDYSADALPSGSQVSPAVGRFDVASGGFSF